MQTTGFLETLAPPVPSAAAFALVVFLPSGGGGRVAATAAALGFAVLAFIAQRRRNRGWFRLCAAVGAGLALGALSHFKADAIASAGGGGFSQTPGPASTLFPQVAIEGCILTDARRASGGLLYVELAIRGVHGGDQAWVAATGKVTAFVRGDAHLPRAGTILVQCKPPSDFRPAARARIFVDRGDIQLLKPPPLTEARRLSLRAGMLAALGKAGGEAGPLLEALFLGVRDELDTALVNAFRDAGCAHILALSGQHVGVLAGLAGVLLGPLLGKSRAKPAACILAALYLALVGPSPSVTRAIFMFWAAAALSAADRPRNPGTILSIVFIIAALLDPPSVRSLSFQLSYLAVAGIAAFSPGMDFVLRRWIPPVLSGQLAVGLASLAATAPLSILVFGRFNPFSPLVSAIAGVLVGGLMWLGAFLAPGVAILPVIQPLASWTLLVPFRALSWLMTAAASLPALEFPQGPTRTVVSLAVALACALVYAWPHARYQLQLRRRRQHASGQPLTGYLITGHREPGHHEPGIRKHANHKHANREPGPGSIAGGLQLSQGSVRPAGDPGPGHAQEVRPELPHQFHCQAPHSGAP